MDRGSGQTRDPSRSIIHAGVATSAEDCLQQGNLALVQGRLAEAEGWYRQALAKRPEFPQAWTNLGTIEQERGNLVSAIECHRRSVQADASFVDGLFNLANAYKEIDEAPAAIEAYRRALELKPDFAQAHLNLGLALLTVGRLEEAWPHYEARFLCSQPAPRGFERPRWDGRSRSGSTLLVHWEQGWGDVMMFSRYLPMVKQGSDMRVVFEVPRKLMAILRGLPGVDEWVAFEEPLPEFDAYAPLMSLPLVFSTSLDTIPTHGPYLVLDEHRVKFWRSKLRERLSNQSGPSIGIAWQGDPTYRWDSQRSIPLKQFEQIAKLPGVQLISLQKGFGTEQLLDPGLGFDVEQFQGELDVGPDAFLDSAALMQNLDLVITADTAVAHLAGSLGVRTCLLLSKPAHWAWLSNRSDSPWYPSIKIFRQSRQGDWSSVFEKLSGEIQRKV